MSKLRSLPEYVTSTLDEITDAYDAVRKTYRTTKTKDMKFRLQQIRKLYWGIVDNQDLIEQALQKDMRKCKFEAAITEYEFAKNECLDFNKNLEKWAKDENVVNVPMQFWPMKPRIRNEALGVVLIIGAYNYPFMLNLTPLVGAIAAGNTVLLKPSELSPYSAAVIKKIFDEYLDPDSYRCVLGKVEETKHILEHKFDKIVFTGGKKTGTIIAKKAAETLTPYLLELGGQNPVFITKNADVKLAARRVMWQKCLNAGQVCLSHNYVLIDRSRLNEFIAEINKQYRIMMPKGAQASPDFSRLPNKGHFDRLKAMLDNSKGKIVMGGKLDEEDLFIEPTAVLVNDIDDSMVVEESFGPIWSIMPVDSLDQAIDIANEVDPTPLTLFTFGTEEESEKVLRHVTSGGATKNDAFFHCSMNATPLGGIGSSGQGAYHGYYSFKTFSHQRPIASVPKWAEKVLRVRYMPYSMKELNQFLTLTSARPNFDRNGDVVKGIGYWLSLIFRLGSKKMSGATLRWAFLLAIAAFLGLKKGYLGQ